MGLDARTMPGDDSMPSKLSIGEKRILGGIEWTVIAQDGGGRYLLLASENLSDADGEPLLRKYHEEPRDITWADSDLRAWLNGEFLDSFTDEERAMIALVRLINNDGSPLRSGRPDTVDRVFCLSSEEFKALIEKCMRKTFGMTWLRTQGFDEDMAEIVSCSGTVDHTGQAIDCNARIRPAIWVDSSRSACNDEWFFSTVGFGKMPSDAKQRIASEYLASLADNRVTRSDRVEAYIKQGLISSSTAAFRLPDAESVAKGLVRLGFVTIDTIDDLIDIARREGAPKVCAILEKYARAELQGAKRANPWSAGALKKLWHSRFRKVWVNDNNKKTWSYADDKSNLVVEHYKGVAPIAAVPRTIGKYPISVSQYLWTNRRHTYLSHVIMPETIDQIDWNRWNSPVVHALEGTPAYQSAKEAGLTIAELHYLPHEEGSYEKAAEARMRELRTMSLADQADLFGCVMFGGMTWNVLCADGDKVLLFAKNALEGYGTLYVGPPSAFMFRFDASGTAPWAQSTLRAWLNGEFLHRFSAEELEMIVETKLSTPDNPEYHTSGGEDTVDKVFCLSFEEAQRFVSEKPLAFREDDQDDWWLRSPGYDESKAMFVRGTSISTYGYDKLRPEPLSLSGTYVRPAMWVKLHPSEARTEG